jgi:hypothetical protein
VSARIALPKRMMPCSKFLFLATIFPKNVGERGGGGVLKIFSGHLKRGSKNFTGHKPVTLTVKKCFRTNSSYNMGETLIFGPISVKFRSINSIQLPLKAM